jgi:predicted nucleic acid-binding protein
VKGACLLDTCVLSELARPRPDAGVLAWLEEADESSLYLSVITLGELEKGIARLPASARRRKIERWVRQDLAARFEGRLLDVDRVVAERWGAISGESEAHGAPLPVIDALIAATALTHGLDVATRNTSDLERCGARCVNPWEAPRG